MISIDSLRIIHMNGNNGQYKLSSNSSKRVGTRYIFQYVNMRRNLDWNWQVERVLNKKLLKLFSAENKKNFTAHWFLTAEFHVFRLKETQQWSHTYSAIKSIINVIMKPNKWFAKSLGGSQVACKKLF